MKKKIYVQQKNEELLNKILKIWGKGFNSWFNDSIRVYDLYQSDRAKVIKNIKELIKKYKILEFEVYEKDL